MRNHPTTAARADIGRTPQLCQDALIEMLKELFAGKLFCGQEGRKALKIYKQDLPIPQSDDADVDTDKAEAPYIVVRMTGGQIEDDDSPQTVDFSLIVCAYDTGLDREGWQDVANIKEDIIQQVCKAPYFGGAFTVLKPITWALQEDDTHPYYFGACIPEWVPILGGKSFSVNIPTLPMLARGGFTDGVSIAGEAGTEAVISFQRGVRSDNINTWTQAGRMLGVSGEQAAVAAGVPYADGGGAVELATLEATQGNNAVELQEIDTGKPQPEQDGGGTPDGGGQVVFAPQITVQGNADRAVLESVLDDAQQRFELWHEQMMRRKARTAY